MIAILFGDEPYKMDAKKNELLSGCGELLRFEGEFTADIQMACNAFSLFSAKRAVILKVDDLKALDTDAFKDYLKNPSDETQLLIICRKVDARLRIYKHLKEWMIPCNKEESKERLVQVIQSELSKLQAQMDADALDEFLKRINYFDNADVNLLSVVSFLQGCAALSKEITVQTVKDCVPDMAVGDVFAFAALIERKNAAELLRQVSLFGEKDAIAVLSALLRDLRISYKLHFFEEKAVGCYHTPVFHRHKRGVLAKAMKAITENIEAIKTGRLTGEIALKLTMAEVMEIM